MCYYNLSNTQSGNVLIYILIAVVLFAALSFAFTQTQQGGSQGTLSDAKAKLHASQLIDQANDIKKNIQELYILGDYDQVQFNAKRADSSGDVYIDDSTTETGRTVGIFSDDGGMQQKLNYPEAVRDDDFPFLSNSFLWVWQMRRIYIDGEDLGTSAMDEVLFAALLNKQVCKAINEETIDSTTIPDSGGPTSNGWVQQYYDKDGTLSGIKTNTSAHDIAAKAKTQCHHSPGEPDRRWFMKVLKVH